MQFEAIILQYGVPNIHDEIISRQAALSVFDHLRKQEQDNMPIVAFGSESYYLLDVRMEGDETQGKVYATFRKV